jgi:hypothetical protein
MLPPAQVDGPHVTEPPHPSAIVPQFIPDGHAVSAVHGGLPQTFGVPLPPQIWPAVGHAAPQSRMPPQPSAICPQLAPTALHVVGVHVLPPSEETPVPPQTLGVPPPPQVFGKSHGLQ